MTTLETLKFNNLALCSLPVDNETKIASRRVEGACFAVATPTPVSNPHMVAYSLSALSLLDLPLSELSKPMFEQYMSGNRLVPGSQTAAHCYCGHQSGYFSGQLGDGCYVSQARRSARNVRTLKFTRATLITTTPLICVTSSVSFTGFYTKDEPIIPSCSRCTMYLGEVLNNTGERWEIQLKGAGQTPFSNNRDGRKVLRSSIREFLCCEAMFHLGIPTTRAGCCVTSDTFVDRDKNHTGKTVKERASLVLRIAPTFLRFGSFEIFKAPDPLTGYQGPSAGKVDILHQLLDYTINNFFPQISTKEFHCRKERYLAFYKEVVLSTAGLVADWQCVGFCHGVANTDNTSIIGITIDYGPFGFLDYYDPNYISQSYDPRKRNSYKNQPEILKWNLLKLAEAIQDVVPLQELRSALEELFDCEFEKRYYGKMKLKLGLLKKELPTDKNLIKCLFDTMEETGADFTNTFRFLYRVTPMNCTQTESDEDIVEYLVSQCVSLKALISSNSKVIEWSQMMATARDAWRFTPNVISHLEKEAEKHLLDDEHRKQKVKRLKILTQDEKEIKDRKLWTKWIGLYRERLDQEFDQQNFDEVNRERVEVMKSNNPRFVLRNFVAQRAVDAAENGDFSVVRHLLKRLETPYSDLEPDNFSSGPTSSNSSCSPHQTIPSLFNSVLDGSEIYQDKPPDDAINMRLS